jgi:hypothetical protein
MDPISADGPCPHCRGEGVNLGDYVETQTDDGEVVRGRVDYLPWGRGDDGIEYAMLTVDFPPEHKGRRFQADKARVKVIPEPAQQYECIARLLR